MSEGPRSARGAATYQRIIEAATREFAEHGIAGARTERVIAAAHTNKAQLYGYFGSKDGLFDVVFAAALAEFTDQVRVRDDDLADWAVRLYDEYLRRPELVRLVTWARLERTPTGPIVATGAGGARVDDAKTGAIETAQDRGRVRGGDPADVMAIVIAMSMAWSPVSNVYAAHADEPETVHARRRETLRAWVQAAATPDDGDRS